MREELSLPGVFKIFLRDFVDERGFFEEMFRASDHLTAFVQDNHSFSKKGTIRGLHFQEGQGQAKLVTPLTGKIFDVFVDIRPESSTFGKWGATVLDAEKHEQLFLPGWYAHGFAALEDSHVLYKVSSYFEAEKEKTIAYNDPSIGVEWPFQNPILSERDLKAEPLKELVK